jgi:hypothetical protein
MTFYTNHEISCKSLSHWHLCMMALINISVPVGITTRLRVVVTVINIYIYIQKSASVILRFLGTKPQTPARPKIIIAAKSPQ